MENEGICGVVTAENGFDRKATILKRGITQAE